jgi:dephospho-CoA kinase
VNKKPFIVGLTGGIGSGKSTVAKAFSALGIKAVDADFASRAVVQPGMPALSRIVDHFAEQDIISPDGHLNRPLLREIIFADTQQKQWLEALLHPLIRDWIIEQLHAAETEYVILESPLLFETDQYQLVDVSLVVDVPTEVQLERASARDNNDKVQIQRIIDTQMSRQEKNNRADFVIDNSSDTETLTAVVIDLHQQFLKMAESNHR